MQTKQCNQCKKVKPTSEFYHVWSSQKGKIIIKSNCKKCDRKNVNEYNKKRRKREKKEFEKLFLQACKTNDWSKLKPTYISVQRYRKLHFGRYMIGEHRFVMMKYLKRFLGKDEMVHHKNRDRLDNRIKNLRIITLRYHSEDQHIKSINTKALKKILLLEKRIKELEEERSVSSSK